MAANPQLAAQLATLLAQSLSPAPDARRTAEQGLEQARAQPGYGLACLQLAADGAADAIVRQSAAVAFKNYVRKSWAPAEDADAVAVPQADRDAIKRTSPRSCSPHQAPCNRSWSRR
jgi:exportin-2 (importin alpha re-exporter)